MKRAATAKRQGPAGTATKRGAALLRQTPKPKRSSPRRSKQGNIKQHPITKEEIIERTIYGLVNEGANILDEGHALRSVDIDIVYVYGYGFPAFRGGPMFYADTIGLKKVYDRVCQFEKEHGFWWKPSPLLKRWPRRERPSPISTARSGAARTRMTKRWPSREFASRASSLRGIRCAGTDPLRDSS